jgi:tRNA modification GTPase
MRLAASALTPPSEGGIGVVLLAGRGAIAALAHRFRGAGSGSLAPEVVRYGWLHPPGRPEETVDEVLVRVRSSADLGVEAVEVSGHGGRAAMRAILRLFEEAGAAVLPASDLVRELSGAARIDRVRLEALERLPAAASVEAACFLVGVFGGNLSRAAREAEGDRAAIEALLARERRGRALVHPPRILLLGRPNAGKSTLFNALAGRDRALTSPEPGTTRDLLEVVVVEGGWPLRFVDSAGIETPRDRVQEAGIERSLRAARDADLRVVLLDGSEPLGEGDRRILDLAQAAGGCVLVATKADLPDCLGPHPALAARVAAPIGQGLSALCTLVREALGLAGPPPGAGDPAPFTGRQVAALQALWRAEPGALADLLGAGASGDEPGAFLLP